MFSFCGRKGTAQCWDDARSCHILMGNCSGTDAACRYILVEEGMGRVTTLLLLHPRKWSSEVPPNDEQLLSRLDSTAFYAEGRAAIYVNLQLRTLVLLAGLGKKMSLVSAFSFSFFFFSVCLECHGCKDLLVKAATCNFFVLFYCSLKKGERNPM